MSSNSNSKKTKSQNEYLDIPKWVNEEYFRPIIERDVDNFASIVNFTPSAATVPGENFASVMVRVVIDILLKDGSHQQVSYILKTMLESNVGGDMINSMGVFPKEKKMYQVHIPQFIKLYKEAGVEDIELAPKCVHIEEIEDRITIVLEDLKRQSFQNVDRLKGFDMNHIHRVLYKLAEFHAASARNFELNGPYDEMYRVNVFTEKTRPMFVEMFKMREKQLPKAMQTWNLPKADIDKYIAKLLTPEEYFDASVKVSKVDENDFNVLNHGDSWSNNIMFNFKENGDIDKTTFVDFQMCKWGSPANDLWFMIITSAKLDIKVKEFDHFIQVYHERLVECLKLLKYSKYIPTLKELHIMMLKYGFWGPITAFGVLVLVSLPADKDANIKTMMSSGPEGEAIRYKSYSNPYYGRAMELLLPFFEHKGLLSND